MGRRSSSTVDCWPPSSHLLTAKLPQAASASARNWPRSTTAQARPAAGRPSRTRSRLCCN
eukprot:12277876-Alexandrium_andersonii.AAC.1